MKEKRRALTREGSERRMIERISEPRVKDQYGQIRLWVNLIAGLAVGTAVLDLGFTFAREASHITQAVFETVFLLLFASLLFQYSWAIGRFTQNESVSNLNLAVEKQLAFWKTLGIFLSLFLVVYLGLKI